MNKQAMPVFLNFNPTEILSKGVVLDEVNFELDGERKSEFHMATFDVAPGVTSDVDIHDVRETWYVLEGRATLQSGDRKTNVQKGNVVYLESRVPHQLHNEGEGTLKVLALWW